MWGGIITINGTKVEVSVFAVDKDWYGFGKSTTGNILFDGENIETEIGEIIINKFNIESGEFEFLGSGKPKINI